MNISLEGVEYSIVRNMDAFTQLRVARRLAPAIQMISTIVAKENVDKEKRILSVLMFSYVTEENMILTVNDCLATVFRRQDDKAYPVLEKGVLKFDDMTLDTMLKLAMEVLELNLGDFFRTALADLSEETK